MLRPLGRQVVLLESSPSATSGGVAVESGIWSPFLDYVVLSAPGETEFGAGDRVVLKFTESGRKTLVNGIPCRVVRREDILAVVEE